MLANSLRMAENRGCDGDFQVFAREIIWEAVRRQEYGMKHVEQGIEEYKGKSRWS
jgi:hypothetical protein